MQEDGEEETKGLAKRAIGEDLDVTQRKANVTFMRAAGAEWSCLCGGPPAAANGLTGVRATCQRS